MPRNWLNYPLRVKDCHQCWRYKPRVTPALRSCSAPTVSPGGVFNNQDPAFVEKLTRLIPMGRMARVGEYRAAIQFLCSDASSYMTGQNLVIDGGRSMW
jgi:NAD(P)-dependent dehydrogenase (short-subunit alcohol dehydrogenase family)